MSEEPEAPLVRALIKHRVGAVRIDEEADTEVGYIRLFITDGRRKMEVNVSESAADTPEFVERWARWMADALRRPRLEVKP
jgi:hypothetical protein